MKKMPSQGLYLGLLIVGFVTGILWGVLSLGPYRNLKAAIEQGDVDTACANAKKIRMFVIIGIVVSVLYLIGRSVGA